MDGMEGYGDGAVWGGVEGGWRLYEGRCGGVTWMMKLRDDLAAKWKDELERHGRRLGRPT